MQLCIQTNDLELIDKKFPLKSLIQNFSEPEMFDIKVYIFSYFWASVPTLS